MMKKIYFRWRHNNKLDYVIVEEHPTTICVDKDKTFHKESAE